MELDAVLDQAVERLKPVAMAEKVGILVTRLAPDRFEVCLNSEVPRGMIMQRSAFSGKPEHSAVRPPEPPPGNFALCWCLATVSKSTISI